MSATMTADPLQQRLEGPAPVAEVAIDLIKRGLIIAPAIAILGSVFWGTNGAISTVFALGIILVNFAMAAGMLAYAGRISFALMGAAALFGFLIRLSLIFVAFWLVKDAGWFEAVPFGITVIVSHLGLLFWEMRYVSSTLAYPGLKPRVGQ